VVETPDRPASGLLREITSDRLSRINSASFPCEICRPYDFGLHSQIRKGPWSHHSALVSSTLLDQTKSSNMRRSFLAAPGRSGLIGSVHLGFRDQRVSRQAPDSATDGVAGLAVAHRIEAVGRGDERFDTSGSVQSGSITGSSHGPCTTNRNARRRHRIGCCVVQARRCLPMSELARYGVVCAAPA